MGLTTETLQLAEAVRLACIELRTKINGNAVDLSSLTTTDKANLVAAINELKSDLSGVSSSWDDITGKPAAVTALTGTNTGDQDLSGYATNTNLALKAPLASPSLTGTATAETLTVTTLNAGDTRTFGSVQFDMGTTYTYGAGIAALHRTALGLGALSTVTPGTGVATALAVNTGSAGSPVLYNGSLGTPTSGTLTNCTFPTLNQNTTGSAATLTTSRTIGGSSFDGSANVTSFPAPGAIGGTTPSTGAFTTVSVAGNMTFTPTNTYDIGGNGVTQPRTIYVAGGIVNSGYITIGGSNSRITSNATGSWQLLNGATTSGVTLNVATDGTLKVRNRSDNADAIITASNFKRGTGSPESSVSGSVGDLYLRTDGGASTTLYVKESGSATTTGWIAK